MNWDAVSAVGDFLSGIAVVATLIYLARQLRDTARQQRMDGHRAVSEEYNRINDYLLSAENTGMFVRALSDWERATAQEQNVAAVFLMKLMNHLQTMYLMRESGTIDDSVYESEEDGTLTVLATSGGQSWWKIFEFMHAAGFRDRINKRLSAGGYTPITELVPYWHRDQWPRGT